MKKNQIKQTIADAIKHQNKAMQDAETKLNDIIQHEDKITALLALTPNNIRYVSFYGKSIDYTVQVKGFNTAKTKKLLESYMDVGGMRVEMESSDNPEWNTRVYKFFYFLPCNENKYNWYADFTVSIRCELIEGGTACRRVQVGEKVEVVKTPEYKFVCK
jgi:hypothetical protein